VRTYTITTIAIFTLCTVTFAEPIHHSQSIFQPQDKHVHGSSLAELPNGDLLACWFHGSGERTADDVLIQGARLKKGRTQWSDTFLMADTPGFPDCNPILFLDQDEKLWLFWITVRANGWQHSILRYRTSSNYGGDAAPVWDWQDLIVLKFDESFPTTVIDKFRELNPDEGMWAEYALPYTRMIVEACRDKAKRQEGWMTRNHPLQLTDGRMLLPLYSDGFNLSLAAISDDGGKTWRPSAPIVGLAGIQPTIVEKKNGDLAAYMRDAGGPPNRVLVSRSSDRGETWSAMRDTPIPNPSSSLQVRSLKNDGLWAMIYNDTENSRGSMAVALSDDEGETWKWKRHIGRTDYYAYPSLIQDRDGLIHISYTFDNKKGKTIHHDTFNIEWIQQGDR